MPRLPLCVIRYQFISQLAYRIVVYGCVRSLEWFAATVRFQSVVVHTDCMRS